MGGLFADGSVEILSAGNILEDVATYFRLLTNLFDNDFVVFFSFILRNRNNK